MKALSIRQPWAWLVVNKAVNMWDRIDRKTMSEVINWTRAKVAAACNTTAPRPISLPEPPAPPVLPPEAGLPLFDMKRNTGLHRTEPAAGSGTVRGLVGGES
jgi:hypothetical protein